MLCYTLLLTTILAIMGALYTQAAPTHELRAEHYLKLRTKFSAQPTKFSHDADDSILNALDTALAKISNIYMQALFSGTHTPELDVRMRSMEIELFDLLDALYRQQRMSEYMKYEGEVTRQMILYNMLKKLFGYSDEENEKVK